MSARSDLLAAVVDCLEAITIAGGYNTDAGMYITREPGQVAQDAPAAVAVVIDRQTRATDPAVVKTHRLTDVLVIAKVPAAQDQAQAQLDGLLDDIERAMDAKQASFPNRAQYPQYVEMQPIPPEAGEGWTGAVLRYRSHIPIR